MTPEEAKRILLLYRPGLPEDEELREALEEARRDPELAAWLERHNAAQEALRQKFREIPVPATLKDRILAESKIVRLVWWRRPAAWLAAAAAIALLIGLDRAFLTERKPDRFPDFRESMVETVLRQYRMDITTNDAQAVRSFLGGRGAPADYIVPKGLQQLKLMGGGLLRWRGNRVSMICFDRGDREILYFFVLERSAVKDAPADNLDIIKVNKLTTASWITGDRIYVLAAPDDAQAIRRYL